MISLGRYGNDRGAGAVVIKVGKGKKGRGGAIHPT